MLQLSSANCYLKELADFVQIGGKSGSVLTEKVMMVLGDLSSHRSEFMADKLELAKMEHDVRQIQSKILELACVKNSDELANSILWTAEEQEKEICEKLRQGFASMINLLTARTFATFSPYYHSKLLEKGIESLNEKDKEVRHRVRDEAEKLLKEAYNQDNQAHFLLRDPSSQMSSKGFDLFTLSFIQEDGTIDHKLLIYFSVLNLWGENGSKEGYRSLSTLVEKMIPGAKGIRAEANVRVDSNSYSVN